MNFSEIEMLIANKERETIKYELKSFDKLLSNSGKDIAAEIVALANRFGGVIIFGIDNEGNFEGRFSGDIDKAKENLYNISKDSISPFVDLQITLQEHDSKEVIIVDIPKKGKIPHAYVKGRKSHEIQDRVYYIRTSHGKKLVTDSELALLFAENKFPEGELQYRLSAEFTSSFSVYNSGPFNSLENHFLQRILENITLEERNKIFANSAFLKTFLLEAYPYLFLKTFITFFRNSWYIGFDDGFDRVSSGAMINEVYEKQSVNVREIPKEGFTSLKHYIPEFDSIFTRLSSGETFYLPIDSKISLSLNETHSMIIIEGPLLNIKIQFWPLAYGANLHQKNPIFQDNVSNADAYNQMLSNFYHFDCACYLNFQIKVDSASYIEYKRLEHYINSIDRLIKKHFDIYELLAKMPPQETRIILSNLNEILNMLKDQRKVEENDLNK